MDDERKLVQGLMRRDPASWAVLYDRHVSALYGVIYHLLGRDHALAEDVHQEVWLLAIERAERFDPARGEFRDWLVGIARHRALRRRRGPSPSIELEPPGESLPPHEVLEGIERADVVRAALLCLHDERRQVLLEKYAEGLSVAEIAARAGKSAKAIESVLSRAREQLRRLLRPYFAAPAGECPHASNDARTA